MATVWHGVTHQASDKSGTGVFAPMLRVAAWIGERRARTQALRELERMDERDLRDLRISPYDFDEIAKGTFRR